MPSDTKLAALKLLGFEYLPLSNSEYLRHNASGFLVGFKSNIEKKWTPFSNTIRPIPDFTIQAIEILNGPN
jgi:hypothetical protein